MLSIKYVYVYIHAYIYLCANTLTYAFVYGMHICGYILKSESYKNKDILLIFPVDFQC